MSNKDDELIGSKIGRLLVLSLDETSNDREKELISQGKKKTFHKRFLCKCDCGNESMISVLGTNLRRHHTTSCGCIQREKSLVGKTYNKLYVESLDYERNELERRRFLGGEIKRSLTHYKCRCECGNYCSVQGSNLTSGNIGSCGCISNWYDLTGVKFGRLTVIALAESNNVHETWECICDCGNKSIVQKTNLLSGHTTSCGCYMEEVRVKSHIKYHTIYERIGDTYKIYDDEHNNFFIISSCDFDDVIEYKWHYTARGYWERSRDNKKYRKLHQYIEYLKDGEYNTRGTMVDHINRNKNDNTRENLRKATSIINGRNLSISSRNKTGKIGVSPTKSGKYLVYISIRNNRKYLGTYENLEDAIRVRKEEEIKYGFIGE